MTVAPLTESPTQPADATSSVPAEAINQLLKSFGNSSITSYKVITEESKESKSPVVLLITSANLDEILKKTDIRPDVDVLSFDAFSVKDDAVIALAKRCPNLTSLRLGDCSAITDKVSSAWENRKLKELVLRNTKVTGQSVRSFPSSLEKLDLLGCKSIEMKDFDCFTKFKKLKELEVGSTEFPEQAIFDICRANGGWVMQKLGIGECPNIPFKFAHLYQLTNLTNLDVHKTEIDDSELKSLSQLPSLASLNLSSCSKIKSTSALHNFKSLRILNLEGMAVSEEVATGLFAKIKTLEEIKITSSSKTKTLIR